MQPAPGFGIVLIFKQRVLSFVWWLHMKSWKWSSCTSQIHTSPMWPWASFPHVLFVLCGLSSQQISVTTFREMIKLLSQSVFWLSQRFFSSVFSWPTQRNSTPRQCLNCFKQMQCEYLRGHNYDCGCDEDLKAWMKYFIHSFPKTFNRCCKVLFIQTMSTCTPSLLEVTSLCQQSECFHTPFTLILSIVIFRPLLTGV